MQVDHSSLQAASDGAARIEMTAAELQLVLHGISTESVFIRVTQFRVAQPRGLTFAGARALQTG